MPYTSKRYTLTSLTHPDTSSLTQLSHILTHVLSDLCNTCSQILSCTSVMKTPLTLLTQPLSHIHHTSSFTSSHIGVTHPHTSCTTPISHILTPIHTSSRSCCITILTHPHTPPRINLSHTLTHLFCHIQPPPAPPQHISLTYDHTPPLTQQRSKQTRNKLIRYDFATK